MVVIIVMLFIAVHSYGETAAVNEPLPSAEAARVTPQASDSGSLKWILSGTDAVLTGISVYLLMDQRKVADDYDKLYALTDNTSPENYRALLDKKKEGEAKSMQAGIFSGVTAVFLVYTALDIFWLHIAFSPEVKTVFNPYKQQVQITWDRSF